MSVLKRKRRTSKTEVFHHLYKIRREMTNFLIRDFAYDINKANHNLLKTFGVQKFEELSESNRLAYHNQRERLDKFHNWFIINERKAIIDNIRNINKELIIAEYITINSELSKEQFLYHKTEAIGWCYQLLQELQYIIETLPVDVNKFLSYSTLIQTEISLIKNWNKIKGVISDPSSANFANVNSNGNANNNNASNVNGVRPDFATGEKASVKTCNPSVPGSEGRGCPS